MYNYKDYLLNVNWKRTFGSFAEPGDCPALVFGFPALDLWLPCLTAHTIGHADHSSDAVGPLAWSGTGEQERKVKLSFICYGNKVHILH